MRSVCECSRKLQDIHCMPSRAFDILNNARISSPRALFTAPTLRERTIDHFMVPRLFALMHCWELLLTPSHVRRQLILTKLQLRLTPTMPAFRLVIHA